MEQVIIEILKRVGIYERVREKVDSDRELVTMFDEDFQALILKV